MLTHIFNSLVDGDLGWFHISVIVKSAAINTAEQVSLWYNE